MPSEKKRLILFVLFRKYLEGLTDLFTGTDDSLLAVVYLLTQAYLKYVFKVQKLRNTFHTSSRFPDYGAHDYAKCCSVVFSFS